MNALLVAAPESRMEEVQKYIKDQDKDNAPSTATQTFHLREGVGGLASAPC